MNMPITMDVNRLSSSNASPINPYKAMHLREEEPPHHTRSNTRSKSSSRKKKRKDSASNKKKSNTFLDSSGALDDEQKRRNAISSQKILIRKDLCPTMLGFSYLSSSSAVSRMSATSAVNRVQMQSLVESMRRDRDMDISGRVLCGGNREETLHQFDEQRKALLAKWQAMSEQRKASRLSMSSRTQRNN
jgi:hypothetical protein